MKTLMTITNYKPILAFKNGFYKFMLKLSLSLNANIVFLCCILLLETAMAIAFLNQPIQLLFCPGYTSIQ